MPDPVTGAIAVAGGAQLAGGAMGARASRRAAREQRRAAADQLALQERMFREQQNAYAPFRQAGLQAQNALMLGLGLAGSPGQEGYGALMKDFGAADFETDPGYQFRLSEGMKALDRQAAARGGTLSGSALKATQRYGQDVASQEYSNAFNRYMANRASKLGALGGLTSMGAGTASGLAGAAGQFGQVGGQSLADIGNARASGIMGPANAYAGALGGISDLGMTYGLMNALGGGGGSATGGGKVKVSSYESPTIIRGARSSGPRDLVSYGFNPTDLS